MIVVLIGALVIALLSHFFLSRKEESGKAAGSLEKNRIGDRLRRLNAMKERYAVMTETLLMQTQDEDLLEAVLSNLWAKMMPDMSDAFDVIERQNRERQALFAIYAVTGGVKQEGFDALKKTKDARLLPVCGDALRMIGAAGSAGILEEAMEAEKAEAYDDPYLESFDAEDGKAKMIAFIRENPRAFCDLA